MWYFNCGCGNRNCGCGIFKYETVDVVYLNRNCGCGIFK